MALPHKVQLPIQLPHNEHVPAGMTSVTFAAMGTTVQVIAAHEEVARAVLLVEQLFAEWERQLSRFRSDSELTFLNQHAGSYVLVNQLVFEVVSAAIAAAQATDGIYDPALLLQLQHAGYDRSFEQVALQQPESATPALPGGAWRAISLVPGTHAVYLPPGVQIDLGGIAKGMAVDAALSQLRAQQIDAALVNAGGDLGVIGLPAALEHWPVAVPDGTVVRLTRGALATSAKTHRHWRQGAQERHHLIDPRSGTSAHTDVQTATVTADHCMQAEVAAKVAFILGSASGLAFLRQQQLQGTLCLDDGTGISTDGWPHAQR